MLKKLMVVAWLGLIGLSLGCDGEKGDVGPAGPAGPAGAAGAKGDTGVAGKDGITAKELVTAQVNSTNGGYTMGKSNLTPADTAMLSSSVVVVFIKAQNLWWALPGKVDFAAGKSTTFNFITLLRGNQFFIDIRPVSWTDGGDKAPERVFQSIRAVIIPSEKFRRNAEVDWNNYEEVVSTLGLTEKDIIKADL